MNNLPELIATASMRAYNQGMREERKRITRHLQAEVDALKQYGRTELWGLHKAMMIINDEQVTEAELEYAHSKWLAEGE